MIKKTIQLKLFTSYSLLIIAIIIIFISIFYVYTSSALKSKASESIQQASNYISAQVDEELENMDRAARQVVFSNSVKEDFFSYCSTTDNVALFLIQRELFGSLYSIFGSSVPPIRQMNLFNLNGDFIGVGTSSSAKKVSIDKISSISWVDSTLNQNGRLYITAPHKDDWSDSGDNVISLLRTFTDTLTLSKKVIVEVQQYAHVIPRAISSVMGNYEGTKKVYVFDSKGNTVYSSTASDNSLPLLYWNAIQGSNKKADTFMLDNPMVTDKEIMAYTVSDYSGWSVAVVESQNSLLKPVVFFGNITILAGIGILLLTLLVSFLVARGLTIPIKQIHRSIRSLDLEVLAPPARHSLSGGFNELEELNIAFRDMCSRLESSLAEVVSSRSHEIQARMLALQSKMNPHFLYNTITTISALAEKTDQCDIVQICQDLSSMLRYILSDTSKQVSLEEEINYTICYLNLMCKRYKDHLQYEIDIPEDMKSIKIPKLIVQPLVENCIKYGIDVRPPWKINVKGRLLNDIWELSVYDNGQGFQSEKLLEIDSKLNDFSINDGITNASLEGIGLVNIYTRLKLLYGDKTIFEISNLAEGGAMVKLGGATQKEASDFER